MKDDKPKFTPGPWHESDDMSDPVYITCARRKICSINYMEPYAESDANAALISQCPSLYANEETSCYVMSQALDFIQRRLTKQDNLLIIEMLKRQIAKTEKLLAKCRGEVKEYE